MIRVLHLGLGQIGKWTVEALLAQAPETKLVGVVDIAPGLVGRPLRAVLGHNDAPGLRVAGSLREALSAPAGEADVATMTTGSRTVDVRGSVEELIRAGVHVVTTCEELAFPALRAGKIAKEIDRLAKEMGVVVLGTGVNPGFAMDAFALTCTAPCTRVKRIRVVRSLDARKRREQLQKKVGAGMSLAAVKGLIRGGAIGHVGLGESCAMIAAGLGWKLEAIRERFTPVVAKHAVASQFFAVKPGQVCGMRMTAVGIVHGKKRIELDLTMALGAETFDEVIIEGTPALRIRTVSGFPGDASTVGMLVNCARLAPRLEPGLRTMMDVLAVRGLGER